MQGVTHRQASGRTAQTEETSPFGKCRPAAGEHVVGEPWAVEPPPAGVFAATG